MTHSTAQSRAQLETLWQRKTLPLIAPQPTFSFPATIRRFATELLLFFTGEQRLRIWTKSTKQGVVWFAYDPMSDKRISHCSEDELRTWLESRYR